MSDDVIWFEDMVVGTKDSFGGYEVTREEVIEFASKYDPQPFHLDDAAAAATYFRRLSASGWHTAAMAMRMNVDRMQGKRSTALGSPGLDELRWIKPVYPGDTLRVETELVEKRTSQSRPEMGITKSRTSVFNQHDELVLTFIANGFFRTRPKG